MSTPVTPATPLRVSEAVEGVVDTIRKYGWVQGEAGNVDGGFCIAGGLLQWCGENDLNMGAVLYYEGALEEFLKPLLLEEEVEEEVNEGIIPDFNDKVATSQLEVEEKLMEIAKDLRNQGK